MGINRKPAYRYESTGKGKRLKIRDFSIYHVFCRWADNTTRECELYLSYICRHLGISHNSLVTHLQHLEGARLISMERGRIDPETGAPAPTWFKLRDGPKIRGQSHYHRLDIPVPVA
jgi:hypothetical protein